ncbi:MAG: nitroreductase family protein [Candidatus Woesearchaeota archaeon]
MDFAQVLTKRRSCKKYLDKMVPRELIGAVVEAGGMAPSAGDKQNWKFIVVRDKEKRDQIAKLCRDQYWMAEAPVHIVICSVDSISRRLFGKRGELYSVQNCALAAENILLASTDIGLGSCVVSALDEEGMANLLGVPDSARVQSVITLGYPAQKEMSKKENKPIKEIMNIEAFGSDGKDISGFLFDWSVIIRKQVSGLTDDVIDILKRELKGAQKSTEKSVETASKKIKKYLEKKFIKREF